VQWLDDPGLPLSPPGVARYASPSTTPRWPPSRPASASQAPAARSSHASPWVFPRCVIRFFCLSHREVGAAPTLCRRVESGLVAGDV